MGRWEEFASPQAPLCWQLAWPVEGCGIGVNRDLVSVCMLQLALSHPCDHRKKNMALLWLPSLQNGPGIEHRQLTQT